MKRFKARIKKEKKPPLTERYCVCCQKKTIWEFKKGIGHSECTECGAMFARRSEL